MNLPEEYVLRTATAQDAEIIQVQRDAMYTDMGSALERVQAASADSLKWLRCGLESGAYSGVLIETGGWVVAGAGVIWQEFPPSPRSLVTTRAYILNVYVATPQRGQGLARHLMQALLAECAIRNVSYISLHASDAGKRTYEKLGFGSTNELRLIMETP
ncbi:GNAT family N-acetyltransferase [Deinococcus detaillensis]|uniref:GNAT family N-acetyltransferase n=1 Tax=Deinococcus detaillensis TaxID=2592048 RepID=A0A553V2T7_9DEIO|nr:GNAT family N-acetyltransferase [Deinococcus detaillensis]TSA86797.1 GNAT family N-acetyltransferase [Deinococcus detaillensis]